MIANLSERNYFTSVLPVEVLSVVLWSYYVQSSLPDSLNCLLLPFLCTCRSICGATWWTNQKKNPKNQPSKTKSYKGGEGRVLGLVHINSTVCFALWLHKQFCQHREGNDTGLKANCWQIGRGRQDCDACLCCFIQIINCGVWFQAGVGRWVATNTDVILFKVLSSAVNRFLKKQKIE